MEVGSESRQRTVNLRKRPLQAKTDGPDIPPLHPKYYERSPKVMDRGQSHALLHASTLCQHTIQDEVEEHFKRSLARIKSQNSGCLEPTSLHSRDLTGKTDNEDVPMQRSSSVAPVRTSGCSSTLSTPVVYSGAGDRPYSSGEHARGPCNQATAKSTETIQQHHREPVKMGNSSLRHCALQVTDSHTVEVSAQLRREGTVRLPAAAELTTCDDSTKETHLPNAVEISRLTSAVSSVGPPAVVSSASPGLSSSTIQEHLWQQGESPHSVLPRSSESPHCTTLSGAPLCSVAESVPSLVHIIDSTVTSQLMAVRNSPVVLLPTATGNLPFSLSQQPYILVNPLDLALRQTFQPAAAATLSLPTASATSNTAASTPALTPTVIGSAQLGGMPNSVVHVPAGRGCIVLTASPASSTSEGTATTCTSAGRLAESTIEHHRTGVFESISTVSSSALVDASGKTATTSSVVKKQPLDYATNRSVCAVKCPASRMGTSPVDLNMTPATVDDHFAKALGEQWPQLKDDHAVAS